MGRQMKANSFATIVQNHLIDGKEFKKLSFEEKVALAFQKLLEINDIKEIEVPDAHDVKAIIKQLEEEFELQAHFLQIAMNDTDNQDYDEKNY
jgi:adenylosuccinate lyase